jgi:hypothetical protein
MSEKNGNNDAILLRGAMEVARHNAKTGDVVEYRHRKNTVVTAGRRWVLERIYTTDGAAAETIGEMAIGGSTDAATTALSDEQDRKAIGTFTTTNLTSSTPSWLAASSWATNEGNTTLGEVGLFNSASAGTMLARATFSTIDKQSTNTLSISYTISN